MTTDHLRIDGQLVGKTTLSMAFGERGPADQVFLFRTWSSTWAMLVLSRTERYDDDGGQVIDGKALVAVSYYDTVAELAEAVSDTYPLSGWRDLLGACDPAVDPDLAREWATERVHEDFEAASIHNKDLATTTGLLFGEPVPALGRQLEDWRETACQAMAEHLVEDFGYRVLDELPAAVAPRGEDQVIGHDRVVGRLGLGRYGYHFVGVVRVDEAGEIFVRLPLGQAGPLLVLAPDDHDHY